MEARYRDFFAGVVCASAGLSECREPKAALIVRGEDLLVVKHNKTIIPGSNAEYSAIRMAICEYLIISDYRNHPETEKAALFTTYFPMIHEIGLIMDSDIRTIYYFGDILDLDSYKFFNSYRASDKPDFEFINLKNNNKKL